MWRHSSLDLSLLRLPLSPRTAVSPRSAKLTSWKVNPWVNLVVVFPHPQSPMQVAWWFFGQNCLMLWELCRKKTAQTKPISRHASTFFPIWAEENNFNPQKPMGRWISCWKTVQCWIITTCGSQQPLFNSSFSTLTPLGPENSLWLVLFVHCRMFSCTPDLYPPDASGPAPSHPLLWQPKVFSRHH